MRGRHIGPRLGAIVFALLAVGMASRVWVTETPRDAAVAEALQQEFDYYVLALSWSPSYCALEGDRAAERRQCQERRAFILHGLWPQYENGWPSHCDSGYREPGRRTFAAMAPVTPDRGLVRHQWRKHGTCSGLSPDDFFSTAIAAWHKVEKPDLNALAGPDGAMSARDVETAFLQANPRFSADAVTVKCREGRLNEVRICFTKDLGIRACGQDVVRDCRARSIEVPTP